MRSDSFLTFSSTNCFIFGFSDFLIKVTLVSLLIRAKEIRAVRIIVSLFNQIEDSDG